MLECNSCGENCSVSTYTMYVKKTGVVDRCESQVFKMVIDLCDYCWSQWKKDIKEVARIS